jgi:hypothetical protein
MFKIESSRTQNLFELFGFGGGGEGDKVERNLISAASVENYAFDSQILHGRQLAMTKECRCRRRRRVIFGALKVKWIFRLLT